MGLKRGLKHWKYNNSILSVLYMQILSLFGFTKALFLFFFFLASQIPPSGHFIFLLLHILE